MKLTVSEIHECVGGKMYADEDTKRVTIEGLTWDSRNVTQGCLFIAMPGERVDGNDFIVNAIVSGAGAVLCTKEPTDAIRAVAGEFACPLMVIEDPYKALYALAGEWRSRIRGLVIGVTGSTGKTSTKDMLAAVLSQRYNVHATEGNHNNELGVPYTVLATDEDCDILIVEMGMRGLGQIEELCSFVQPSIGLVTNVGVCHLELLGSRENIARAKGELVAALPPTGLAVINTDDGMLDTLLGSADAFQRGIRVCKFGFAEGAYTHVSDLTFDDEAHASFRLGLGSKEAFNVTLSMPGKHNVSNALAVACVADYLGLSAEQMTAGFGQAQASKMRMEIGTAACGARVINDAYNANPDSMRASLETLASMQGTGRKIAVLGDMGELGPTERELHEQVGACAARQGIDLLVCIGELAKSIAEGAAHAGMEASRIACFEKADDAISALKEQLREDDIVLVKASRFMGLEQVVKEICA